MDSKRAGVGGRAPNRPGRPHMERNSTKTINIGRVQDKIEELAKDKRSLQVDIAEIDRETEALRRSLQMKTAVEEVATDGADKPAKDSVHEHVYPVVGFRFRKAGNIAAKEIDAIIHKSRRKGLRGWIKRGALGVHGEVWGVGDRDAREAQWSAMQDYLSVQLEYTTEPLGRRQESEIRLGPEFSLRDPRRKSIVSLV